MKRIATYDNRYKQAVETRRMILIVLLALGCVLLLPLLRNRHVPHPLQLHRNQISLFISVAVVVLLFSALLVTMREPRFLFVS